MYYKIKLKNPNDVKQLNDIACDQNFDLTVSSGSTIVNARSILALFTLIGKSVSLVAPDHIDPDKFISLIKKLNIS